MMTGKQKLYFLLDGIEDTRVITPSGKPLIIDPLNDLNNNYRKDELSGLFFKLTEDEKVIKLIKAPSIVKSEFDFLDPYDYSDDGCWHIELLPAFDRYYLEIQQEPEYQDFTGKKPIVQVKPKLSRKSLEKIWGVLQEIEDKRGITSAQYEISIPFVHFSKVKDETGAVNASDERRNILKKLEVEENAIRNVRLPDNLQEYVYLRIGERYFDVFKKYEEEYKRVAKDYQQQTQAVETLYQITYTPSREVLLNKTFQLAKPDFDTENDLVFSYLSKNPNQKFTRQQIEEAIGKKLTKDLHKIVENLGFKSDLRKMFFSVSATSISFKNPITQEDLEALGIQKIKIS